MSSQTRIVAVIGSTGHQGSGVVRALLSSTAFTVRAITRNPSSDTANALVEKYPEAVKDGKLEIVVGDLTDPKSVEEALEGVDGVFAAWGPSMTEREEGKALVDLVKRLDIPHFIYSSLPSLDKASGGKFKNVQTFEAKADIEKYAREVIPEKLSVIIPGAFFNSLERPSFARRDSDDTAVFCFPASPKSTWEWLQADYDIGVAAAAIFSAGPSRTTVSSGRSSYPLMGPGLTPAQLAAEYEAVTGEQAVARPDDLEASLKPLPEAFAVQMREVFQYMDSAAGKRYYGAVDPAEEKNAEELGIKVSTVRDFLERTGWRVPK
ncbi:hypothetical protein JCM8097_009391 [Rhodosporidiobolus ruineniae]